MRRLGAVIAAVMGLGQATAQPLVGPWPSAAPTTVLVLGTPHLSRIARFEPKWLDPLLARLADWKPQLIAIEGLSGPECYLLRRFEKSWPGTADDYCVRVEAISALAARTTGLDMPAAEAAVEIAVAKLGPGSTPDDRREMAALFAAAGNLGSAATQWLRLAPDQRRAAGSVDTALAKALDELSARRNENYLVAATLAARLGLERVYPCDDHLSDRIQAEAPPGLGEAMQQIRSHSGSDVVENALSMERRLDGGAALLAYYRTLNRPDVGEAVVRADMGRAFEAESPAQHGRRYVGWWEARNLRMVANVRAALARKPGDRALVIVGATHKPYFDTYLGMMHEVRLEPVSAVLQD